MPLFQEARSFCCGATQHSGNLVSAQIARPTPLLSVSGGGRQPITLSLFGEVEDATAQRMAWRALSLAGHQSYTPQSGAKQPGVGPAPADPLRFAVCADTYARSGGRSYLYAGSNFPARALPRPTRRPPAAGDWHTAKRPTAPQNLLSCSQPQPIQPITIPRML